MRGSDEVPLPGRSGTAASQPAANLSTMLEDEAYSFDKAAQPQTGYSGARRDASSPVTAAVVLGTQQAAASPPARRSRSSELPVQPATNGRKRKLSRDPSPTPPVEKAATVTEQPRDRTETNAQRMHTPISATPEPVVRSPSPANVETDHGDDEPFYPFPPSAGALYNFPLMPKFRRPAITNEQLQAVLKMLG
jgi:hypothetical protein